MRNTFPKRFVKLCRGSAIDVTPFELFEKVEKLRSFPASGDHSIPIRKLFANEAKSRKASIAAFEGNLDLSPPLTFC
jgi:hypothetical protein